MKRFILTGTPGSGKTTILRQLEIEGFGVVEEAATDVIALSQARGVPEPWTDRSFLDAVVSLQTQRELRTTMLTEAVQFHDRSVVCSAALAIYLQFPFGGVLERTLERTIREKTFEKQVFFVRNLGFVSPTEARRISFDQALRFEHIHEEIYRQFGFELISIAPGSLEERVATIKRFVADLATA